MQSHAKIVIVGGGIMGPGLLYHLAEEGCTDVLLIENAELTSGGYGHRTAQSLGFGYAAIAYSAHGTVFEVEILGGRYPATVLAEPVWDPSYARQRA